MGIPTLPQRICRLRFRLGIEILSVWLLDLLYTPCFYFLLMAYACLFFWLKGGLPCVCYLSEYKEGRGVSTVVSSCFFQDLFLSDIVSWFPSTLDLYSARVCYHSRSRSLDLFCLVLCSFFCGLGLGWCSWVCTPGFPPPSISDSGSWSLSESLVL